MHGVTMTFTNLYNFIIICNIFINLIFKITGIQNYYCVYFICAAFNIRCHHFGYP